MTTLSVLGGGGWGTALALCAERSGNNVMLWMRDQSQVHAIQTAGENISKLAGIPIPKSIHVTSDLTVACNANIILIATPAQTVGAIAAKMNDIGVSDSYIIGCSKGIDIASGRLMSDILLSAFPGQGIGILSGPSFAREVASHKPTAATIAASELEIGRFLASSLSSSTFRLYPSADLVGVSVGGALKNVIAIASGLATAQNLGESARASLITRGLAEITRLGTVLGGNTETFLGLSGVGDLLLSCTSPASRNMAFGLAIGSEDRYNAHRHSGGPLTEGFFTAKALHHLSDVHDVDLPICASVYRFLYEGTSLTAEINGLLTRPLKFEGMGA